MKTKVLIVIPHLGVGGTEIQTFNLAQALRSSGYDVGVLCLFRHVHEMEAKFKEAGVEILNASPQYDRYGIDIDYPTGFRLINFVRKALKLALKRFRPDVVHVQYMTPATTVVGLLHYWFRQKCIVTTVHTNSDIYTPKGLNLFRKIAKNCSTVTQCITLRAEKGFFGTAEMFDGGRPLVGKGNHFTIYNALPSYISIADERVRQGRGDVPITIGVVSRLEGIKGMDLVVPAFARVCRRLPDARLLVVGDGTLRERMQADAATLGVADRVEFTGRKAQAELQECYDRIDILLMPSRSEGFGLTAIEGMARGCVVVAADTGGLPEVVTQESGRLHKVGNVHDLAERVVEIASDRGLLYRLSRGAMERSLEFTQERYRNAIAQLYARLL